MASNNANLLKYLLVGGMSAAGAVSTTYLIIPSEGSVKDKAGMHTVYLDAVGIPTACYGQTGVDHLGNKIKLGMTYSETECLIMLQKTVEKVEKQVDNVVKVPYTSDYQKAALISFTYNLGIGNLQSSTLLKKLNTGNHSGACDELSKWVYAQKKLLRGLVLRRAEEKKFCLGQISYEVKNDIRQVTSLVRDTTPIEKTPQKDSTKK
jgi:lysozyme